MGTSQFATPLASFNQEQLNSIESLVKDLDKLLMYQRSTKMTAARSVATNGSNQWLPILDITGRGYFQSLAIFTSSGTYQAGMNFRVTIDDVVHDFLGLSTDMNVICGWMPASMGALTNPADTAPEGRRLIVGNKKNINFVDLTRAKLGGVGQGGVVPVFDGDPIVFNKNLKAEFNPGNPSQNVGLFYNVGVLPT